MCTVRAWESWAFNVRVYNGSYLIISLSEFLSQHENKNKKGKKNESSKLRVYEILKEKEKEKKPLKLQ